MLVIGTVVAGGEEFNILAGKSPPFREEMKRNVSIGLRHLYREFSVVPLKYGNNC